MDEDGRSRDGFLRLNTIYNLRLSADLVVLSACQTALGKEVAGEGLVGLTRGFMYAGARRVIASLWQVNDLATAELMKKYQARAGAEGVDPLGYYMAPFGYAQYQMLGQAIEATKSIDDQKLADYIRKTTFKTVAGDIAFGPNGAVDRNAARAVQRGSVSEDRHAPRVDGLGSGGVAPECARSALGAAAGRAGA